MDKQTAKDAVAIMNFVDELIRDRKDPNVTENNLKEVREMLFNEVSEDINRHLVNLLSEEKQIELDKMLDNDLTNEALLKFLEQNVPNIEAEIASVLLNFRAAYLHQPEAKNKQEEIIEEEPPNLSPAPVK